MAASVLWILSLFSVACAPLRHTQGGLPSLSRHACHFALVDTVFEQGWPRNSGELRRA